MSLILNIDTSTEQASICLADNDRCLAMLSNDSQKEHAAWLHPAIQQALQTTGVSQQELAAVGITTGPGSYTGLRVGMATAKGLCYVLGIPLVGVNTLEAMATVALHEEAELICPMIDARRMEVFTALYTKEMIALIPPCAMILEGNSLEAYLKDRKIIFFGSGKDKFSNIINIKNALFKNLSFNASDLARVIYKKFAASEFLPLAYAEPLYLKEHYTQFVSKS